MGENVERACRVGHFFRCMMLPFFHLGARRFLFPSLLPFVLTSCGFDTPYSLQIHTVNETGPQQPAAITLSDPQIYKRETLVNDRLREATLIKELLAESAVIDGDGDFRKKFTPQIIRDIVSYTALAAKLNASLDPAQGAQYRRDNRKADLQNSIDQLRLQRDLTDAETDLIAAQKRKEAARQPAPDAQPEQSVPADDTKGGDSSAASQAQQSATAAKTSETNAKTSETNAANAAAAAKESETAAAQGSIISRAEAGRNEAKSLLGTAGAPVEADTLATPQDRFRDLQAYRAELRQALAALNLDDLHDQGGNALYRLQFLATVMPGEHKDKHGVARVSVLPPRLTDGDINRLYLTWLNHLTYRMNPPLSEDRTPQLDVRYGRLSTAGLFELIEINFEDFAANQCRDLVGKKQRGRYGDFDFPTVFIASPVESTGDVKARTKGGELPKSIFGFLQQSYSFLSAMPEKGRTEETPDGNNVAQAMWVPAVDTVAARQSDPAVRRFLFKCIRKLAGHKSVSTLPSAPQRFVDLLATELSDRAASMGAERLSAPEQDPAVWLHGDPDSAEELIAQYNKHPSPASPPTPQPQSSNGEITAAGPSAPTQPAPPAQPADRVVKADLGQEKIPPGAFLTTDNKQASGATRAATQMAPAQNSSAPPQVRKNRYWRARGTSHAYGVTPIELAQRLSTVARSANSMEFALSLTAGLPAKGLSGAFDSAYMRASAGNIEAQERAPLVVGFADRRSPVEVLKKAKDPVYLSRPQVPQGGWVFAPQVRVNPQDDSLELIHSVKSHPVSLDLSVPGWWPRVNLLLETAWIGNWHNTSRVIRLGDEPGQGYHQEWFKSPLPLKRADLDALTDLIASKTIGSTSDLVGIRHVEPFYINACLKDATLLIEGANIWRSTKVYLAGVEAKNIRVMPDMEGIAATFDMNEIFAGTNSAVLASGIDHTVPLTVWTRDGQRTKTIGIEGTRSKDGTCVASRSVAYKPRGNKLAIIDHTPSYLAQCATSAEFVFKLQQGKRDTTPTKGVSFYLNGIKGSSTPLSKNIFSVSFPKSILQGLKGQKGATLSATDGVELASVAVAVNNCVEALPPAAPGASSPSAADPDFTVPTLNGLSHFIVNTGSGGAIAMKGVGFTIAKGVLPKRPNMHVSVRPQSRRTDDNWYEAAINPDPNVPDPNTSQTFSNDITIASTETNAFKAFKSGEMLDLALLVFRLDNQLKYDVVKINGPMVYYATEADANATLPDSGAVKSAMANEIPVGGLSLTIKLPKKAITAYPALKTKGVHIKAAFKTVAGLEQDLSGYTLKVTPIALSKTVLNGKTRDLSIKVELDAGKSAYYTMRADAAKGAKNIPIALTFEGTSGPVPTLPDLTIKKSK